MVRKASSFFVFYPCVFFRLLVPHCRPVTCTIHQPLSFNISSPKYFLLKHVSQGTTSILRIAILAHMLQVELETWAAALKAYDEEDFEKSLELFNVGPYSTRTYR